MTPYEAYARQWAKLHNANPDILVKAGNAEGGFNDPTRQSDAKKNGIREPSYGPYQMLIGGPGTGFPEGLGNRALAAGIDPRDPSQWQKSMDYALTEAQNKGWGQWYGPKSIGITGHMGFDGSTPSTQAPAVSPDQVADAMAPVAASNQAAAAASAQDAAVAQQQAATTQAAAPADPFAGLMSLLAMSQQQQAPQDTDVSMTDNKPKQQVDPSQQLAMTSQTPNVYLERLARAKRTM